MNGVWHNKVDEGDTIAIWVHGVISSGEKCWQHDNGTYWPDLLVGNEKTSHVNNYIYTYNTGIFSGDYSVSDAASNLRDFIKIDDLLDYQNIIFICHSLGGLVVRTYLFNNSNDLIAKKRNVGLYLIASPSLGAKMADMIKPLAKFLGHSQVEALKFIDDNEFLQNLNDNFRTLKEDGKLPIVGKELVEDKFVVLNTWWFSMKVVPPFSGAIFFGRPSKIPKSDHWSIAKPENRESLQHRMLVDFVEDYFPLEISGISSEIAVLRREFIGVPEKRTDLLIQVFLKAEKLKKEYADDYQLIRLINDIKEAIRYEESTRTFNNLPGSIIGQLIESVDTGSYTGLLGKLLLYYQNFVTWFSHLFKR